MQNVGWQMVDESCLLNIATLDGTAQLVSGQINSIGGAAATFKYGCNCIDIKISLLTQYVQDEYQNSDLNSFSIFYFKATVSIL